MTKAELIAENKALKAQLHQLLKLINGTKSERFTSSEADQTQGNLFDLEDAPPVNDDQADKQTVTYQRKPKSNHKGRNPIPEHLPVQEIIIEPDQDTEGMIKIGEQVTETLDYTPASLVKVRYIRPRYVKQDQQQVVIGALPVRPIDKGIAEAGLLAHIFVSKFVDHLPFYRQQQMFKRNFDWEVSRSTINDWLAQCCTLMKPLYDALKKQLLQSDYLQVDESPLKVLDRNKKGKTHKGYQWVYHAPYMGLVLFNYRKGRGKHGPKQMLSQYAGYLQCDGYQVYDKIGARQNITLVGCVAHARRKFYEAIPTDKQNSEHVLGLIQKIYALEKQIRQQDYSARQMKKKRKKKLLPLFEEIKEYIEIKSARVLPKSPLGKAMGYYQAQYPKLINTLCDAKLKLDNNLIENKIRPLALGRKNYLFAGSHSGAERMAMLYSFFATCKIHQVNPREWLGDVLKRIKDHSIQDMDQLLPNNWKPKIEEKKEA